MSWPGWRTRAGAELVSTCPLAQAHGGLVQERGSDAGGSYVIVNGLDAQGQPCQRPLGADCWLGRWPLCAHAGRQCAGAQA